MLTSVQRAERSALMALGFPPSRVPGSGCFGLSGFPGLAALGLQGFEDSRVSGALRWGEAESRGGSPQRRAEEAIGGGQRDFRQRDCTTNRDAIRFNMFDSVLFQPAHAQGAG